MYKDSVTQIGTGINQKEYQGYLDHPRKPRGIAADSSCYGKPLMKRPKIDWDICCQWKDGTKTHEKLSDMKESHPVQMAK